MAQEYKRNHTIPRCMLNYWVDNSGVFPGVHVYDINKRRLYKSESRGKRAFSFAIVNNLHIVEVDGKRATSLERWMSSLESTLSRFLKLVHNHSPINFNSRDDFKLAMALLALETRSEFNLNQIQKHLAKGQKSNSPDTKKLTLENLIDFVTYTARDFVPLELIIVHSGENSWLVGDRPFFHSDEFSHRFIILTNKVFLGYRKSPDTFRYTYIDTPSVDEMNRMVALQARDWIVSDNVESIQKYIPLFDEPTYNESRQNDGIEEIQLLNPIRGWEIFN